MTQLAMPFHESAEAATKYAIQASGKTLKEVAAHLWPGRTVTAAQTHLANCLNENRDEKLTTDEHIAIANYCHRFDWLHYAAMQCSHSRPTPVTPEAVAAQLQSQLFQQAGSLRLILDQIEALKPRLGERSA